MKTRDLNPSMKSRKSGGTAASRSTRQPVNKAASSAKARLAPGYPKEPDPTSRPMKSAPPAPLPTAKVAIDYGLPPSPPVGHYPQTRQQEIRARAYLIWEKAGRPEGEELAHWLEAEAEVLQSGNGSHPAMPQPHPAVPVNGSRRRLLDLIIKA
jgi:Protein of unknown function (DUF2934)